MTRAFTDEPVAPEVVDHLLDLARRAPSAGNSQGWHFLVLEGADTARFWDCTLPAEARATFRWPRLLAAPLIVLPFADRAAYLERYGEADKARSGLARADAWPVPYWLVDTSMAAMLLLLAADDVGLGALFFGVFKGEGEVRQAFGVPAGVDLVGAVAIGHPEPHQQAGRSAGRPKRPANAVVHRGRW